jgi:cytochrome c peroxidase
MPGSNLATPPHKQYGATTRMIRIALVATMTTLTVAFGGTDPPPRVAGVIAFGLEQEPIRPVPGLPDLDPAKLHLGEILFQDPRLSGNGSLSCASCHDLDHGGAEGSARPIGIDGKALDFNAPTVFNAALSFRLNWRGNFRRFEQQADAVLLDPRLMGTDWPTLLARLRGDPAYREAFGATYGTEPEAWQVLDALATFQRSLLTPDAPFDRWLRGDKAALTDDQVRGYALFKDIGCVACHQGVNVGGNLFQRFGVFAHRPVNSEADLGRFIITGNDRDRQVFRVPSLRNVAVTPPYFHDGSEATLAGAVRTMAKSQLGRSLATTDIDLLVGFLRTLTGTYRGRPIAPDGHFVL